MLRPSLASRILAGPSLTPRTEYLGVVRMMLVRESTVKSVCTYIAGLACSMRRAE